MMPPDFLESVQPPWVVLPHIAPQDLASHTRQGAAEPWFDQDWRPFWTSLTAGQREQYLDKWKATPEWREAIAAVFEVDPDLDLAEDARESEQHLREWKAEQRPKRSLLGRLFGP